MNYKKEDIVLFISNPNTKELKEGIIKHITELSYYIGIPNRLLIVPKKNVIGLSNDLSKVLYS